MSDHMQQKSEIALKISSHVSSLNRVLSQQKRIENKYFLMEYHYQIYKSGFQSLDVLHLNLAASGSMISFPKSNFRTA